MSENTEEFIKKSKELEEEIVNLGKQKNIKVLYLKHNMLSISGRMLAFISIEQEKAEVVYDDNFDNIECYDIFLLHRDRLNLLLDIMNSDIISNDVVYGYLDTDNKLHTKDKVKQLEFEDSYKNGTSYFYIKEKNSYIIQSKQSDIVICSYCGKRMFSSSEFIIDSRGNHYCHTCESNLNIGVCDICGKVHRRRTVVMDEETLLEGRHIGDELNICEYCVNIKYRSCDNCGTLILKEKDLCNKCKLSQILNYSTKPEPIFQSMKREKTKLFFGWEWEIESKHSPRDIAYIANTKGNGLMYCKHDGSIRNGCEIVTHPMTYNFFKHNEKLFKDMFKEIKDVGGHSFDMNNTGCHVHISRAGFRDEDHIINFTRCIYQEDFSQFIALRKGNHYAHYNKFSIPEIRRQLQRPCDRYRAVNFCNRNTIEIRIYKGTINYDVLLMYLQHIICCMKYSESMNVSSKFNTNNFLKFIEKQRTNKLLKVRTKAYKDLYIKNSFSE